MKTMHRQQGVTLIELVVVMIIVGILTAIAVPSYRNYVLRSQRSDAKDAVSRSRRRRRSTISNATPTRRQSRARPTAPPASCRARP